MHVVAPFTSRSAAGSENHFAVLHHLWFRCKPTIARVATRIKSNCLLFRSLNICVLFFFSFPLGCEPSSVVVTAASAWSAAVAQWVIRAQAIGTYRPSRSMPTNRRPSSTPAAPVEPLPVNGSSTVPPGGQTSRTSQRISLSGLTVGWMLRTSRIAPPARRWIGTSDSASASQPASRSRRLALLAKNRRLTSRPGRGSVSISGTGQSGWQRPGRQRASWVSVTFAGQNPRPSPSRGTRAASI